MRNLKTILFVSSIILTFAMSAYAENKIIRGKVWFSFDASTHVVETDTQLVYIKRSAVPEMMRGELAMVGRFVSLSLSPSDFYAFDKVKTDTASEFSGRENEPMTRVEGEKLVLKGTRIGDDGDQFPSIQVGDFIYRIDPASLDGKTKSELSKIGQFVEVKVLGNAVRLAYKLPINKATANATVESTGLAQSGEYVDITGLANYSFNSDQFIVTVGEQVYRIEKGSLSDRDIKKFENAGTEINLHVPKKAINPQLEVRMPAGVR